MPTTRATDTRMSATTRILHPPTSSVGCGLLTAGLLALALAPFDFVSGTEQLHEGLRRTAWWFVPGVFSGVWERLSWGFVAAAVWTPEVGMFFVLGFCSVRAELGSAVYRRDALRRGGHRVLVLAAVAGVLSVFVVSRYLDLGHIVVNALGGLIGARLGMARSSSGRGQCSDT